MTTDDLSEADNEFKTNLQIVFEEIDAMECDALGAYLERVMAEILGDEHGI